jgi:hypothetical protein
MQELGAIHLIHFVLIQLISNWFKEAVKVGDFHYFVSLNVKMDIQPLSAVHAYMTVLVPLQ